MNIERPQLTENARSRSDRIQEEIRMRICLLDYAPGERLSEEALACEFGISRTPLRRVLARLESEGLLRSMHGIGTFVTDFESEELTQTFHLRMELAELTGRLESVLPDAEMWLALRSIAAQAKALLVNPDSRRFARINVDFFLCLLRLTANEPLREVSKRLYFQTTRIWLKSIFASRINLHEEVRVFGHEVDEILRALELDDLRSAALLQRAHISMSFHRMLSGNGNGNGES